jgi:hypothetical protein
MGGAFQQLQRLGIGTTAEPAARARAIDFGSGVLVEAACRMKELRGEDKSISGRG